MQLLRCDDPAGSQSHDRLDYRNATQETTKNISALRSSVNGHFQHRCCAPIIRRLSAVVQRHEIEIHISAPGHRLDTHRPLICHQSRLWKIDRNSNPAMTPPTLAKYLQWPEIVRALKDHNHVQDFAWVQTIHAVAQSQKRATMTTSPIARNSGSAISQTSSITACALRAFPRMNFLSRLIFSKGGIKGGYFL